MEVRLAKGASSLPVFCFVDRFPVLSCQIGMRGTTGATVFPIATKAGTSVRERVTGLGSAKD